MADKKEAAGKKEEGKGDAKGAKGGKDGAEGSENEAPGKASLRSKTTILAGVAGILLVMLSVGGFFAYKTFSAKSNLEDHLTSVKDPHAAPGQHGEKPDGKADEHGAGSKAANKDEHGGGTESKTDAHGGKEEKKDSSKDTQKASGSSQKVLGAIFSIPKMELNVGGPDLNRGFVRLSLAIEYVGEADVQKELEARTPQYRDIIISRVGSTPKNDLLTVKGREELRKNILNTINTVNEHPVKSLYFTEFLVE